MVLQYEEFVKEPAPQLSAVMEFLGRPVASDRVEEAIQTYSAERMRERERGSRFHEKQKRQDIMFVRTAGPGDWARTFSKEDEELFTRVTGDLLRRLGYADARPPG
jgi:hypothetical protein